MTYIFKSELKSLRAPVWGPLPCFSMGWFVRKQPCLLVLSRLSSDAPFSKPWGLSRHMWLLPPALSLHPVMALYTLVVTVVCVCACVCVLVAQSCQILCDAMNYSSQGSFVHGILQARILEWVAIPFSRDWTRVSHIADRFFTICTTVLGSVFSSRLRAYRQVLC